MASPTHALPHLAEAQAQYHVTVNEVTDLIDYLMPRVALSATTTAAPTSPSTGDIYIVPPAATGFGAAGAGDLALWHKGAWKAIPPRLGWRWHVLDEGRDWIFGAAGWKPGTATGPLTGATMGFQVIDAEVDLIGLSVTIPNLIPARAIIFGVTSWVIGPITGATAYRVGDSTDDSRFGAALGTTAGASNVGVVGPFATYATDDVLVSAEGLDFTGGRLGVAVSAVLMDAPV